MAVDDRGDGHADGDRIGEAIARSDRKPLKRYANSEHSFNERTYRGPHGCLLWCGGHSYGYPVIAVNRKAVKVSRYAWERANGPIPRGFLVCHKCDNPACVEVEHLFLGTQKDNMADASRKGRIRVPTLRGEACPAAKLTAENVRTIRFLAENAVHKKTIAEMFGVSLAPIYAIISGDSWKSVL